MIADAADQVVFDLAPDWRVIAFTTAIALLTALLFGAAPALQATAPSIGAALKEDARAGAARLRLLPALVAVQVALSLVLLIGAGLFVRTLRNLETLDPGFRPEGVLFVEFERAPDRLASRRPRRGQSDAGRRVGKHGHSDAAERLDVERTDRYPPVGRSPSATQRW